jgi:hypothetical protein
MIAVRMLARDEYREFLRRFGCELIIEAEILQDGIYGWAYWRTSWGFYFYVPETGPQYACPEHRFYEILADISQRAPRS